MKWQDDGLHKQHPPWTDSNPSVYSAVGQVLLVMKTPERPQLILEYHSLFKFSVNISTLRHLVGKELTLWGKKIKKSSLYFIGDLQYLLKSFLTWLLVRLYAIVDLWDSSGHAAEQTSGLCVKRTGLSGSHRGDNLDHLAVLSLDGTLDGLLHLNVRLQGRGQLSSLEHMKGGRGDEWNKKRKVLSCIVSNNMCVHTFRYSICFLCSVETNNCC